MAFMNLDLATGKVIERGLKSSSNIKHDCRLKTQYRLSVNGDTVEQMESRPIVEYVTGPLCILEAGDENGSDTGTYKYNVFKMWFDAAGNQIKYEVVEKNNILLALVEAETFISTYGFDLSAMTAKKPT